MEHKYQIGGMSCNGCRTKIEQALNGIEGIEATVTLSPPIATIKMTKHIATEKLQAVLSEVGNYTIAMDTGKPIETLVPKPESLPVNSKYYCPMHCEGDKVYDKAGHCPVCGTVSKILCK